MAERLTDEQIHEFIATCQQAKANVSLVNDTFEEALAREVLALRAAARTAIGLYVSSPFEAKETLVDALGLTAFEAQQLMIEGLEATEDDE